jgi:DNA segregation ATPase FtsK/SpoIIIE-like protein
MLDPAAILGPSVEDPGGRDPQFKEAAIVCVQNQGGSTSLLQRKLGIGYGQAARIMDQLEEGGDPWACERLEAPRHSNRNRLDR